MSTPSIIEAIRNDAQVISPDGRLDFLIDDIGNASIVLLGEATHGTHEFYLLRAEISKRLITEKRFDAIAVEADWPDALRTSRFIQASARSSDATVDEALHGFERFPQWMWRNTDVVELLSWLRMHNLQRPDQRDKVGFYGLDLYSLRNSMDAVVRYLSQVDPEAARRARARYACFDHLAEDPQRYGYAASFGMRKDCEDEVIRQLVEMTNDGNRFVAIAGDAEADELFYAQQNARVAQNAEAYYRAMFQGRNQSWNLRDRHMAETLEALRSHLIAQKGRRPKIIVWAHNSHLGDARATEMGEHGQLNLGQLVREQYGSKESFLLGFTTHAGTVTAASDWDAPAERKTVRPSHPDSYERLFHDCGLGRFVVPLRRNSRLYGLLEEQRLERAIGVVYLPETERVSHYFHASLARQFDAVIHVDETRAVLPLERNVAHQAGDLPETYPSGI
ncbi:erythromycin esterase family protein [Noviherbaspirillum denitrificans]|uniref:Erythromycin esterase n=1 Tax=Noviherbaspirillum denitrificans TaxID=1968433 RepID=A0A254TC92_9BURK|nr:erythromycin esterase family protein [Noviherbaspirillum denitrificans]OWW18173.1 erythromycin esterase [Noviherbaspirillum denitrificans]